MQLLLAKQLEQLVSIANVYADLVSLASVLIARLVPQVHSTCLLVKLLAWLALLDNTNQTKEPLIASSVPSALILM
jgi:hypothetical protein